MGLQTLYTGATGMQAMQTKLDAIANNLANVNTTAFKRDRVNTEDLFYVHEKLPGALDGGGNLTPTGVSIGLGTKVSSVQTEFTQGGFEDTGRPLDVSITGEGFFQVVDPLTGEIQYTRAGRFDINANGELVISSANIGRVVEPSITFSPDTQEITIGGDGTVQARIAGQSSFDSIGQLQTSKFINPDGLLKLGENLYAETDASGSPVTGIPGSDGRGTLLSGFLEQSNVKPVTELIDMINTQRAFELNSEAVRAGDQMLQLLSNMRRF
ncbi:MAG: flagellar basal-body rod protein FlgG [Pirellulales bacterium]|nr:flagellar basal-body rod protein FlgG [Pirellulales bacterium]